jgi:hypothetical protein
VVPSIVSAGLMGMAKGDVGTSEDPWSKFCAVAGGGGELASVATTVGVATSAVQQMRFVSLCIYLFIYIYDSFVLLY